jgi:hypothetical protein
MILLKWILICEVWTGLFGSGHDSQAGFCERCDEPFGYTKQAEFSDHLMNISRTLFRVLVGYYTCVCEDANYALGYNFGE